MDTEEIIKLDSDESVLLVVKQHDAIIWTTVTVAFAIVVAILVGFTVVVSTAEPESLPLGAAQMAVVVFLLCTIIMGGGAAIAWAHSENELVLTDENVVQKLQFDVFSSRISQLNLSKVQDVTVNQGGILGRFFDYGTIELETAGEAANYFFKYAPKPNVIAKHIVEAHEDYVIKIEREGNA